MSEYEDDNTMKSALLGLFFYSGLMFTVPIGAFIGAKQILEDKFDMVAPYNQIGGAIAAVLTVNIIIISYVIKAFKEEKAQYQRLKKE